MSYSIRKYNRRRELSTEGFFSNLKDRIFGGKKVESKEPSILSTLDKTFLDDEWLENQTLKSGTIRVANLSEVLVEPFNGSLSEAVVGQYKPTIKLISGIADGYSKWANNLLKDYRETMGELIDEFNPNSDVSELKNRYSTIFNDLLVKYESSNPRSKVYHKKIKVFGGNVISLDNSGNFNIAKEKLPSEFEALSASELKKLAEHYKYVTGNHQDSLYDTMDRVNNVFRGIGYMDGEGLSGLGSSKGEFRILDDLGLSNSASGYKFFNKYYAETVFKDEVPKPLWDLESNYLSTLEAILKAHIN